MIFSVLPMALLRLVLIFLNLLNVSHADIFNYIARGFKHCTGHCEKRFINCQKGVNKQGYYQWCKDHCTHFDRGRNSTIFWDAIRDCDSQDPKLNRKKILEANKSFDLPNNTVDKTPLHPLQSNYRGQIIAFQGEEHFVVLITEQNPSLKKSHRSEIKERVMFHKTQLTPHNVQIGDYVDFNDITPAETKAEGDRRLVEIRMIIGNVQKAS